MPQLTWDALDFLECLEVEPYVDEYETQHLYEVVQDPLRLLITVWQFESAVEFSLFRSSAAHAAPTPTISLTAFVRGPIHRVNDKRGEYLSFTDCIIAPNRFWYQTVGDLFDQHKFPHGFVVKAQIRPELRIFLDPAKN